MGLKAGLSGFPSHGGGIHLIVRSLSAKYRPDRYRRDKSVKFGTELP